MLVEDALTERDGEGNVLVEVHPVSGLKGIPEDEKAMAKA
jgi:hypothetical protein